MLKKIILSTVVFLSATLTLASTDAPKKILSDKEIHCLTETIYYEARGEHDKGKRAVANVVLNRVKSNKFPNKICDVVYQKKQFSWTKRKYKVKDVKSWNTSKELASKIVKEYNNNRMWDVTKGSLYFSTGYHHKGTKRVAKIGSHVFFK